MSTNWDILLPSPSTCNLKLEPVTIHSSIRGTDSSKKVAAAERNWNLVIWMASKNGLLISVAWDNMPFFFHDALQKALKWSCRSNCLMCGRPKITVQICKRMVGRKYLKWLTHNLIKQSKVSWLRLDEPSYCDEIVRTAITPKLKSKYFH